MKIKGHEYNFKFKWFAIREFLKMTGLEIGDISNPTKMTIYAAEMIYCGLLGGARADKKTLDLTLDDVIDWIEDNPDGIEKAMAQLSEDMPSGEA